MDAPGSGASLAGFAHAMRDPSHPPPPGLAVPGAADVAQRFAIHRNNFRHTLTVALAESFPVVRALVGADFFGGLARAYMTARPPRSPILLEHGRGFPDFVAGFAPADDVPYLADVAELEWLRLHAFHAADAELADPAALASLAPPRLAGARVRLHPSAAWRRSRFAAHSLWQAHQYAEAERDAALAALDTTSPEDTLVLRDGAEVRALRLPPGGWAWLTALAADAPLGDALEAAAHDSPHAAADDLLRLLLRLPLVTHFLIPD